MIRWCEIAEYHERERFEALSQAITKAGVENEVSFLMIDGEEFPVLLERAKSQFQQIRLSGSASEDVLALTPVLPSSTRILGCADALCRENEAWNPRNYLIEGLGRAFAKTSSLDLTGGVFILGATPETRALVAALTRIGFNRFNIADPNEGTAQTLVEDLRKKYFGAQFAAVPRHLVTQLPGVHSIAVNTLVEGRDEGALGELFYFNFLKPGGLWLDLPLLPFNSSIDAEAHSVGAIVLSATEVFSIADFYWAKEVLGVSISQSEYESRLRSLRTPSE